MTRRSARLLAALVAVVTVSACAAIPSSGPVEKVADDTDLGQSAVRYSPARPQPGASPEQIVRGYLDAMLAYPTSSRTAAAFLTPEAARIWSASQRVRVYSGPDVSGRESTSRGDLRNQSAGAVTVRMGFTEEARLDRQGRYTRIAQPAAMTYSLAQVKGQWRIANPQEGLLITSKFFGDYFRPFDLFFFDRPGRRLVPDPVYLVAGEQLTTTLIASLTGGPSPPESVDASRTYVPPLSALRPSVPVSNDGVADVEFTQDFRDLSAADRDRLSAQVVWTLRQVPGVEGVQLIGGSTALTSSGDEVQPVQAWGGFGPSTARGRVYAVVDGVVVEIDDGQTQPISGTWGKDAHGARYVAVSEAGVAGVLDGLDRVRLTKRDGSDVRTIQGRGLIQPDWDADGILWLVDRDAGGTRVRVVDGDTQRTVDAGAVAALRVDGFEVSPDGSRYALTTGGPAAGAMYVGRVLRDAKDKIVSLGTPRKVFTTASSPRSVSWSSGTELAFLADSDAGVQVYQAAIDGSETTSEVSRSGTLLPDEGADTLAIGQGPSPVVYVTDRQRRLWFLDPDGSWRKLDTPAVTGLAFGR